MLQAFNCEVVGMKRTPDPAVQQKVGLAALFTSDRLAEVVRDCRFLVVAAPLNDTNGSHQALRPRRFSPRYQFVTDPSSRRNSASGVILKGWALAASSSISTPRPGDSGASK